MFTLLRLIPTLIAVELLIIVICLFLLDAAEPVNR